MKPLDLNLASRPYRNDTILVAVYVGLLAVLVGWAVLAPMAYQGAVEREVELQGEMSSMRADIDRFQQAATEYRTKIADLPLESMRDRGEFAREILDRKNFSWTEMFNLLEQGVIPCKVKLLSLHPRYVANQMLIDVRGVSQRGPEGYVEFLGNLQKNPHFLWVYVRGARRAARGSQDVVFDLSFNYFPEPDRELPSEVLEQLDAAIVAEAERQAGSDVLAASDDEPDAPAGDVPEPTLEPTTSRPGQASPREPSGAAPSGSRGAASGDAAPRRNPENRRGRRRPPRGKNAQQPGADRGAGEADARTRPPGGDFAGRTVGGAPAADSGNPVAGDAADPVEAPAAGRQTRHNTSPPTASDDPKAAPPPSGEEGEGPPTVPAPRKAEDKPTNTRFGKDDGAKDKKDEEGNR